MTEWQLALAIIAPILAIAALAAAGYYIWLPRYLVRKIRGGKENLLFPDDFQTLADKVTVLRDEPYESAYPNSFFDLYLPKNGENKGLIIWAHGGFFIAGDKKGVANVCTALAADGFSVAAINYATAPERKYPSAVKQLNDFVAYALSRYPQLSRKGIVIAGDSAGGQIAAQYAALVASPRLRADMGYEPRIGRDTLKSLVLVCAPIDVAELRGKHKMLDRLLPIFGRVYFGCGRWYRSERYKSVRIYDYIDRNFPPCFTTDGNHVSFEDQNKNLARLLRENDVYVQELFFPRETFGQVNHEYLFDMTTEVSASALGALLDFLNRNEAPSVPSDRG